MWNPEDDIKVVDKSIVYNCFTKEPVNSVIKNIKTDGQMMIENSAKVILQSLPLKQLKKLQTKAYSRPEIDLNKKPQLKRKRNSKKQ